MTSHGNTIVLTLHIQPAARRTGVVGRHGDRLKIAVAAPPADGRANAALIAFLAETLALPKSSFALVSGASSREKRVAITTDRSLAVLAAALLPSGGQ
jgi:uncharacterized protein (TIGR00251 family)